MYTVEGGLEGGVGGREGGERRGGGKVEGRDGEEPEVAHGTPSMLDGWKNAKHPHGIRVAVDIGCGAVWFVPHPPASGNRDPEEMSFNNNTLLVFNMEFQSGRPDSGESTLTR